MCSEFENCTGFVVNLNTFLNLYRAICVGWLKPPNTNTYLNLYRVVQYLVSVALGQPILIMIFGIGWQ
jgi:hypothetical protein